MCALAHDPVKLVYRGEMIIIFLGFTNYFEPQTGKQMFIYNQGNMREIYYNN
jgi:hypothetical protein